MIVKNKFKINISMIIFFLSYLSLIYSFFINEDGSGSGARGDFESTYGFILALQENLLTDPVEFTLVHTPLHFIILSFVERIIDEPYFLRLIFCLFSIIIPIFFLKTLKLTENNKFNKSLIILSTCIFFLPAFRYTSIWANDLITSLVFFIISIFYFKKWEANKTKKINRNVFLQIIFLALATYTRQYFAVFFIYFLYRYYLILNQKSFINLFLICVITSVPVLIYAYIYPVLITGQHISINSISYFLLGNSSMISLYLLPIILINLIFNKIKFKKEIFIYLIFSIILVFFLSLNFDPSNWQGGGINFMISKILFNNNIYFLFTSVLTYTCFIYLYFEKKINIVLILILLFMFFSYQAYQRYYEPMFYLIFFTLFDSKLKNIFKENINASFMLLIYCVAYYLTAISDFIYK